MTYIRFVRSRYCFRCRDKNLLIECGCGCGQIRPLYDVDNRRRKFIAGHQNRGQLHGMYGRRLDKCPRWKGGILPKDTDYLRVYQGNEIYKPMHRLLLERKLGRKLGRNEVAHHINGKPWDNRPENLMAMETGKHLRLHRLQKAASKAEAINQV